MQGCDDIDLPLSYRFGYYFNTDDLNEDIIKSQAKNINFFSEFSEKNELSTILPIP